MTKPDKHQSDEQLVKDLRSWAGYPHHASARSQCMVDAAEAIERLQAELADANESADKFCEQSLRDLGAAAKLEQQLAEARAEIERKRKAITLFTCVIKSGEGWSDDCQRVYDEALAVPAPETPMDELQRLGQEYDAAPEREAERREQIKKLIGLVRIEDRGMGRKSYHIDPVDCIPVIDALAAQQQALESGDAQ